MNTRTLRVCYFGFSDIQHSRNRIYREALRARGVEIVDCLDSTKGWRKWPRLWKKHREIRGKYDVMIVAYPGHAAVPFARLVTSGPVILDALCSLYEAEIISRRPHLRRTLYALRTRCIDFIACHLADRTLVETEAQVAYFRKQYGISERKCRRVFTSADESVFFPDPSIRKHDRFTVVFRGRFLPEAGVRHVVAAAKLLENEDIDFRIYGHGLLQKEVEAQIEELHPRNLVLDTHLYPFEELRVLMASCHVSLGQLEKHERLLRTIPHKAFESMAMKLPYITGRYPAIQELLKEGESALMFEPGNAEDLAEKILLLCRDPELRNKLADAAYATYRARASQEVVGRELTEIMWGCLPSVRSETDG